MDMQMISHVSAMLKVAERAIEHHRASQAAKEAKEAYYAACRDWKAENGYERYEKIACTDEEAAEEMFTATAIQAHAHQHAKLNAYNAKRRLETAIRKVEAS